MKAGAPEAITVSIRDAAAMLGISTSTAYELIAQGTFPVPVVTIGRRKVVSRRRLTAYAEPRFAATTLIAGAVSIRDAAAMLGISTSTAYELIAQGTFPVPVVAIGRRKVVSRRRLVEFVDGPDTDATTLIAGGTFS